MLTPQEVQEKRFEKAVFGGYETGGVDDFLESVSEDYTTLYKENAILKSKLKTLVDKIEEYRSVDDQMRKTLLTAQQSAQDMKHEAARQADEIMKNAELSARGRSDEVRRGVEYEEARLAAAKEETLRFVNHLRELYRKEIELLSAIPDLPVRENPKAARDEMVTEAVKDIDESVASQIASEDSKPVAVAAVETESEPPVVEADEPDAEPETSDTAAAPDGARIFEVNFGDGADNDYTDIWEQDEDTVVPRPRTDFEDFEFDFGPKYDPMNKGKKGG